MNQSKMCSVVEQSFNMASGFILAALCWAYVVAPMIRVDWITIDNPIIITVIFTVVSFIRGLFWRRFFNNIGDKLYEKVNNSRAFWRVRDRIVLFFS